MQLEQLMVVLMDLHKTSGIVCVAHGGVVLTHEASPGTMLTFFQVMLLVLNAETRMPTVED
jgi:hypothetical protein